MITPIFLVGERTSASVSFGSDWYGESIYCDAK